MGFNGHFETNRLLSFLLYAKVGEGLKQICEEKGIMCPGILRLYDWRESIVSVHCKAG